MIKTGLKHLPLIKELTLTLLKLKDQSTLFGFIWTFLNPLAIVSILFIFFRLRIGPQVENYGIYLLIGIIQYTHFSNSTGGSMHVLVSMRQLTGNTIFPKEILVMSSVLSSVLELVLSMAICLLIAQFTGLKFTWALLLLPLVLLQQVLMVFWVSLCLACLYIFVRDIDHIYHVFLRVLLFTTPIFYDLSFLGDGLARKIALLNPLTHLILYSRQLIISGKIFPLKGFALFTLANIALIILCLNIFRKAEPSFAEHI
jgi:lipopolysaccharide transport system permease protein